MFLRTLRRLANPVVVQSLAEESTAQAMVFASADDAEFKAARAEKRPPATGVDDRQEGQRKRIRPEFVQAWETLPVVFAS